MLSDCVPLMRGVKVTSTICVNTIISFAATIVNLTFEGTAHGDGTQSDQDNQCNSHVEAWKVELGLEFSGLLPWPFIFVWLSWITHCTRTALRSNTVGYALALLF